MFEDYEVDEKEFISEIECALDEIGLQDGHMSRSNFNTFIYVRQVNKGGKLAMHGSKQKRKRVKREK